MKTHAKITIHVILTRQGRQKRIAFREWDEAECQVDFLDSEDVGCAPHRIHTINRTVRLKSGKKSEGSVLG